MADDKKKTKGDEAGKPVTSVEEALARGQEAVARVKPKNAVLYWALTAQTLVLRDIRDAMRHERSRAEEDASGQERSSSAEDSDTSTASAEHAAGGSTRTRSRTTGTAKSRSASRADTTSTSRNQSASSGPRSQTRNQ
ncbi:peptidoglycan hydrolase CwlO-like protein [Saccharopolyspora lacisalsi]|uniref:Peptidoglycan hydrolase CwlO-like protein n=1 Tax=Halosaccharopolyspora lacisalsi TaxID=1000566 RepID=A0A839DXK8_9PSEU|nr:hypothetical protein [Halosaccharopolyspora lacisalsi]MBA8824187.1 peptidoglycan hydrolase CwlO-like protein [Halosaccharopolyspora lacisalsi]